MKVLMVDVDGVLVHGRPVDGLPLFTHIERDLGLPLDLFQQSFFERYWPDIVTGKEPIEPRLTAVLKEIAPSVESETLLRYWFENDSRLDQALLADLAALRKTGVALYVATNQEHRRAAYLMDELGLGQHFDGIFYSAELGHKKPALEFFQLATAKLDIAPQEIGLLDDTLENVDGARLFGWNSVHWTASMTLSTAIASLNSEPALENKL